MYYCINKLYFFINNQSEIILKMKMLKYCIHYHIRHIMYNVSFPDLIYDYFFIYMIIFVFFLIFF